MLRSYIQVDCKNCLRVEKEENNEFEKKKKILWCSKNVKDWNLSQSEDEEIEFIFKKKEEKK